MRPAIVSMLLAVACAAQPVSVPVMGVLREPDGGLRRIFGVTGNLIPGRVEMTGVLRADFRGRSGLVKTARELIVLDEQARPSRRMPAPPGPAIFGFDAAGEARLCYFPETGELWDLTGAWPMVIAAGDPGLEAVRLVERDARTGVASPNPQIFVLTGEDEQPVRDQFLVGAVAAGDPLDTRFRVRNTGTSTIAVEVPAPSGEGFSLVEPPAVPVALAPGGYFDCTVRFQPTGIGTFSAVMRVGATSTFLVGQGVPALSVYVQEAGIRRLLSSGSVVEFGDVERGGQGLRRLLLENQTSRALSASLVLIGSAFRLADPAPRAVLLEPLESTVIEVLFEPRQPGSQQGELRVGERRFLVRGSTVEPPLPRPAPAVDLKDQPPASARQLLAAVRFDPLPRTSGSGTLRLEFRPLAGTGDDPAIVFPATGSREIPFTVIEGTSEAQFGTASAVRFQTGTTAGRIVLRAELGNWSEEYALEIPPSPVAVDAVKTSRDGSSLELRVTGYDNTRTLGQASFAFLDRGGAVIATARQDVSADFRKYFEASALGGVFLFRAVFPLSGSADLIGSVEVELTNAEGSGKARANL